MSRGEAGEPFVTDSILVDLICGYYQQAFGGFLLNGIEKSTSLPGFMNLRAVYLGLFFELIDCSSIYYQFALVGMFFEK